MRDALADAQQAKAAPSAWSFGIGDIEANAIVFDHHPTGGRVSAQAHPSRTGVGVPGDIRERFLNDAIQGAFGLLTMATVHPVVSEVDGDAMPPATVGEMGLERRHEPEIIERRRMQQIGEITDTAQGAVDAGLRVQQQIRATTRPIELSRGDRQLHLHGAQHLSDLVVEFARNPPLLLLLGVHLSSRQSLQIDRNLFLARALFGEPTFEARAVPEREPPDRQADCQG